VAFRSASKHGVENLMLNLLFISPSILLSAMLISTGCAESTFVSNGGKRSKAENSADGKYGDLAGDNVGMDGNIVYVPADVDTEDGKANDADAGADGKLDNPVAIGKAGKGLDISLDPIRKSIGAASSKMMPVDFYFVVDVTGSMQPNIDNIKNNIEKFANELSDKKYSSRLSLITFRDEVVSSMEPTSDIGNFKNKIGMQDAAGGGNANEAGLKGISEAINIIKSTKSAEAYAAIILITDNPAHMGGNNSTDCDVDPIVDKLNALDEDVQKKVKLYGSVANSGANCNGFSSARDQLREILADSLKYSPKEQRGSAGLSYPFEKGTLIDELIPYIERTIPKKDFVCLAESADLMNGSDLLSSWKSSSLEDSYKRFVTGSKENWADAIKDGELEKYAGSTLDLEIKRCCVGQADAAAGNFGGCSVQKQKVKFQVAPE
jgi:hypothetical protein